MGTSIGSDRLRVTGMSGLDTETMIQQLMKAESYKVDKKRKSLSLLQWRQDAYRTQIKTLRSFKDEFLSFTKPTTNFLSSTMFKAMKINMTNSQGDEAKGITARATGSAQPFNKTLEVMRLAQKNKVSSATSFGLSVSGKNEIDVSNIKEGDAFDVTLDGVTKKITIKGMVMPQDLPNNATDEEIADYNAQKGYEIERAINSALKDAFGSDENQQKLSVDITNGKFTMNATRGHTFSIAENAANKYNSTISSTDIDLGKLTQTLSTGKEMTLAFNLTYTDAASETGSSTKKIELNLQSLLAVDADNGMYLADEDAQQAITDGLNSQLRGTGLTASFNGKKLQFKPDDDADQFATFKIEDVPDDQRPENAIKLSQFGLTNGATASNRTNPFAALGFTGTQSSSKFTDKSIEEVFGDSITYTRAENADGEPEDRLVFEIGGKSFSFSKDDSVSKMMNAVNSSAEANATMSFDSMTGTFSLESKEYGSAGQLKYDKADAFLSGVLGLGAGATAIEGKDAIIKIDGVETTRSSNEFDIDGVKFAVTDVALSTEINPNIITISSGNDTDSVVTNIKKFVEEYNNLLKQINSVTSERRVKYNNYSYYEPLTDDEKSAMTDSQITQWEEAAKKGLLYNDSTLKEFAQSLRTSLYSKVDLGDGKSISMFDIGISSTSYYDQGRLSIDEDKLRKALETRPNDVAALFNKESDVTYSDKSGRATRKAENGVAYRINDLLEDYTRTNLDKDGYRGTLIMKAGVEGTATVSSNYLSKQIKEYGDQISSMLNALSAKENRYYSMFAAMEKAMNQSTSQSTYLTQLIGSL